LNIPDLANQPSRNPLKLLADFKDLGKKVAKEIKDAEAQSKKAGKTAHDEATRKEFDLVFAELKRIEKIHDDFDLHVLELAAMAGGNATSEDILNLEHKIEEEEEKLDKSLSSLLNELAKFTEMASRKALADEQMGLAVIVILSIASLLIMATGSVFVIMSIVRPLNATTKGFVALSEGDFTVKASKTIFEDEIREMNLALEDYRKATIERARLEEKERESREAREKRQTETNQLVEIFGASIRGIFDLISKNTSNMSNQVDMVANDATSTRAKADELLRLSETTSENAQQVSAATEEMVASIQEIASQAVSASEIADQALAESSKSADEVRHLKEAAEKIGAVIDIIGDIAEQTNLLALNATIEAARAGDAGKGFAVVASEVKALATQTSNATAEIAGQIKGIQNASSQAADSIEGIGSVIVKLNELSTAITSAITEQEATTQEIAHNIGTVAEISQSVNSSLEDVRNSAKNSETLAENVGSSSRELQHEATSLGGEVDTFLEALTNTGADDEETVVDTRTVDFKSKVEFQGKTRDGRIMEISPSFVLFSPALEMELGAQVTVVIDDWDQSLKARVSRASNRGTYLQLPLHSEHIAKIRQKLNTIKAA
jgi:methyl-accepting chemotaxis protein